MKTLMILLHKEFQLFKANRFLPKVAFIFPFMVILIMPLVANMDVRHVGVTVVSHDNSRLSQQIVTDLAASPFFSVESAESYDSALKSMANGITDVILEIPRNFQADTEAGFYAMPHISANGVNGTKGSLGSRYVMESVMESIAGFRGMAMPASTTQPCYLFNSTLNYRSFMIPALMIMLLIMICGFLPALNLVGEKESGTIEQMNVTPVPTIVFVLSKVIPYWIIGMLDLALAMLVALAVYGLAPAGSVAAIFLAALLFIFVMSGIGIILANYSERMTQAMFLMFFVVLICVLMSGLFTPVSSMPQWAKYVTYILPPRYFIDIMRSIYLKATPIIDLWPGYLILTIFAAIVNLIAAFTYRKSS